MATMRRNRRLPGQSSKYRDHPSNVGSPSYFADTGRGWVPNPGVSRNTQALNRIRSQRQPGIEVANRRSGPSFGYDRSGGTPNIGRYSGAPGGRGTPNIGRYSGAPGGIGGGITATAPGQNYITKSTDKDDEKQAAFDHRATAHFAPWFAGVMDKFGGLTEGAMRGSRLHKSYKDKYGDSKQWEADKKMMASGWDLSSGDPGYEGSDKQFYDKYMNLADMAQDSTKAQEYRDTAETAWRNKQTSDRLAAATGFEDYAPSKYTGVGEGSRYTGSHREAGDFVPGVGIMRDIFDRLPAQGEEYDIGGPLTPAGGPISITDNQFAPGYDQELPAYSDEPVDISALTGDIDYTPYPDEKWDAPLDRPYADIYDFERQRPKSTFTPKLYDEDRTHSTLPLGPRRITSEPGQVTYPFGPNLLDQYYGTDLASDVALGNRGYGDPNEIFEEDEVYFPNNPRSKILGG